MITGDDVLALHISKLCPSNCDNLRYLEGIYLYTFLWMFLESSQICRGARVILPIRKEEKKRRQEDAGVLLKT